MIELEAIEAAFRIGQKIATMIKDVAPARIPDKVKSAIDDSGELLGHLFTAQVNQQALADRIRALEGQLDEFLKWDDKINQYDLIQTPFGHFVYRLKESNVEPNKPRHEICPKCVSMREVSILQGPRSADTGGLAKTCPKCTATFVFQDVQAGDFIPR